jgi:HD superfamily phosphohydrolase
MTTDAHRTYEIRCPVYGFVTLNDWEWQIISQPAYQRLRRIRQLAWTDYVFPGAMHTRFEHSLGVMHMATMLYDGVMDQSREILRSEIGYNDDGLARHKALVRLTALLHDIGHGPFSHAAEELFPFRNGSDGERYVHEEYSAAIVRRYFNDVISNHPLNTNYGFSAEDVANLLEGKPEAGKALFWRDLIAGQLDADRMDYLLRDSLHCGVSYGQYDWQRLVHTVAAVPPTAEGGPRVGVTEGGWHAAEGLIVARYFMFTQVYFHKTRVIYDHHLQEALADLLPAGLFPAPKGNHLAKYLEWDDWRVLGLLQKGKGGDHGRRLAERNHFREVIHTPETPSASELEQLAKWREGLGDLLAAEMPAEKSWYKAGPADIQILVDRPKLEVEPLSKYSSIVRSMEPIRQVRLYSRPEQRADAIARVVNNEEERHARSQQAR